MLNLGRMIVPDKKDSCAIYFIFYYALEYYLILLKFLDLLNCDRNFIQIFFFYLYIALYVLYLFIHYDVEIDIKIIILIDLFLERILYELLLK